MFRIERRINSILLACLIGISVFNCGNTETEAELREQAQRFEKEEAFQDAIATYEKQLKYHPEGEFADEALHKVAFLYYNSRNDFEKAIELHKELIKDYPKSRFVSQARFMLGYINANDLKDYDAAKVAYEEFLEYHSNSELAESVKWELEHLGQDINQQLKELFTNDKSNGEVEAK